MYYDWVLDKPVDALIASINTFLELKFKLAKLTHEQCLQIRRIVTKEDFKDSIHKINDVSPKRLRIYSWAFKCYYDHVRYYSYILLNSINLIELYEQPELFEYICAHIHDTTGADIDVRICLQEHFTQLQFKKIRERRDELLFETDKYALVDYPFKDNEEKMKWFEYRQMLRDLPGSIQNPFIVEFPSSPSLD
tara:strand:- start:3746 stop:4324 length:579 start_codon:yes stop_codon:yes gene_type:complete